MTSYCAMFSLVFVVIIGTATADSSTPYDWTKQICCGGQISSKSPRPYDTGCCGNTTNAYSYSKQLCCYDDTADTYTVVSRPTSTSYCCGAKSYDYTKQICCNDIVSDTTTNTYCCGNQTYDYTKQTCCYDGDSNVLVTAGTNCPIDPNNCGNQVLGANQICCSGWDYTSEKYVYQVNTYSGISNPQCCGLNNVYDYSKQTCCSVWNANGTLQYNVTDYPANWPWWYSWYYTPTCCGLTAYNQWTSLCCSSYDPNTQISTYNVIDYPSGSQSYDIQCCGTTAYNTTGFACCYDSKSTTIPKVDANTLCCGVKGYDSSDTDNQCCNNNALYNVTTQMCCEDYLLNIKVVTKTDPYDTQCCGDVTYNEGSKMCCDETTGPVARPTATSTCCGENYNGCGGYYYPYY